MSVKNKLKEFFRTLAIIPLIVFCFYVYAILCFFDLLLDRVKDERIYGDS